MNRRFRSLVTGLVAAVAVPALIFGSSPAWAADPISPPTLPDTVADDGSSAPPPQGLSDELQRSTGTVEVTVRLAEPSVAETLPEGSLEAGDVPSESEQQAQTEKVSQQQDTFVSEADDLGATELGRTTLSANVVAVSVDAAQLESLAELDNVVSVTPVRTYQTHATDTVPTPTPSDTTSTEKKPSPKPTSTPTVTPDPDGHPHPVSDSDGHARL